jgi:hypothetical protein
VIQGQKFDPEGEYVRRFLPELVNLPLRYLFCPWEAPAEILQGAGIKIGVNYLGRPSLISRFLVKRLWSRFSPLRKKASERTLIYFGQPVEKPK